MKKKKGKKKPTVAAAAEGAASGQVGHLVQLGVDRLVGLLKHGYQLLGLLHVVGREESVRRASLVRACRPADAVDVVLGAVRIIVVDDKPDVVHVCECTPQLAALPP